MARTPGVTDAIGFAVPKDIQNNPVRIVDRAGQRRMWWSVVCAAVLAGGLLLAVWQYSDWVRIGYDVQRLESQKAAEEVIHRGLLLKRGMLLAPQRIEGLATNDLHMVAPSESVVIERVREAAEPVRTLVARR